MQDVNIVKIVMKPRTFSSRSATAVLSATFLGATLFTAATAQTPPADNTSVGITVSAPQPAPKTVWMSRDSNEVLKLVKAGVNDEVVMAYIQHSRAGFNLTADEIVQLHNEGVSDKMINAMLANRKQAPQTLIAAQPQPQPQVVQEAPAQQQVIQPTTPAPTIVTQPSVTYVQSQPVYVPSTSYVYAGPSYYYDPFWYPSISVGFGWGWGGRYYRPYYGGHYYGGGSHYVGYRGGYSHWGGGYHGGFSGGAHFGGGHRR